MGIHFTPISFHGDTVWAAEQDGAVLVALKPICQNLAVDWNGQYQRTRRDHILSQGMCIINIPSAGGEQETVCLPLNLIPGFLFGLDDRRIKDEAVRRKVIAYKLECYDVLFRHFFGSAEQDEEEAVSALPAIADPLGAFRRMDPMAIAWMNAAAGMLGRAMRLKGRAGGDAMWTMLGLPPVECGGGALVVGQRGAAEHGQPIALEQLLAVELMGEAVIDRWNKGAVDWLRFRMRHLTRPHGLWIDNACPAMVSAFGPGWHRRCSAGSSWVARYGGHARRGLFLPAHLLTPAGPEMLPCGA